MNTLTTQPALQSRSRPLPAIATAALLMAGAPLASASFVVYSNYDNWLAAGPATGGTLETITFTELPPSTQVTDQYSHLGVQFFALLASASCCGFDLYPLDGAGLAVSWTNLVPLTLDFETRQQWIGFHHPGAFRIRLYDDAALVYDSVITLGGSGVNFFTGIVGLSGFNRAVLDDPFDGFFAIDNFYFGSIPAPPVAALLGAVLFGRGRRRVAERRRETGRV
ncbi:MAG TPA: hypothetical protein PKC43_02730 [Phycisphaerales bacterium]|nr:hypothetical protein [Phycisphaerales bacterium]